MSFSCIFRFFFKVEFFLKLSPKIDFPEMKSKWCRLSILEYLVRLACDGDQDEGVRLGVSGYVVIHFGDGVSNIRGCSPNMQDLLWPLLQTVLAGLDNTFFHVTRVPIHICTYQILIWYILNLSSLYNSSTFAQCFTCFLIFFYVHV